MLCNLLPNPSKIQKWCCASNFEPGFSAEVLETLQRREKPVICNLVLDEMSIRKQIEYKHEKWFGFVNIGNESTDHMDDAEAKSAFVFLLVAINDNFKVPMGYFLIDSLTGKERANLVRTALILAAEHNVYIPSMTFDGTSVNFTMAKDFGSNFDIESSQAYFIHPLTLHKIFCFPDPTHMMKNARNALGQTATYYNDKLMPEKPLKDSEGQQISWKYIVRLHELQNELGLTYGRY